MTAPKYTLTISRMTVDKLGVKLYDRASAVIAELIANGYDADAKTVTITAPMDQMLATVSAGQLVDSGGVVEIADDGIGMTPVEMQEFFLVVGKERRNDSKRGETSRNFGRKVMGRKGVGKLAPFGVCRTVEIISSGGSLVSGRGEDGKQGRGYLTSHILLDRGAILSDSEEDYHPKVGSLDGVVRPETGTVIRLRQFDHRRMPSIDDLARQLAQRFGLSSGNWKIKLVDSSKPQGDRDAKRTVGSFDIETMDSSKIELPKPSRGKLSEAEGPDGKPIGLLAGFSHGGKDFPVTGWVGYSKAPYRDDLMAGVRIYCRGKIAGRTSIFNLRAGFTGEYDVRSYFVGEVHADWLDEAEDLIRTDRQDILWSHDLGVEFEKWGQALVKKVGSLTREPVKQKSWDAFLETSNIERRLEKLYPGDAQREIRSRTLDAAKLFAKTARRDELDDEEVVESLVEMSLLIGPHITLDQKLREVAESKDSPLTAITGMLKAARLAELAGFGKIADDRVKVIHSLEKLKDNRDTPELELQDLIEQAPWLINPEWAPITANETFETFKTEFAKYYKEQTGQELELTQSAKSKKRADFILATQDNVIRVVEIKKPKHKLSNEEYERIQTYYDQLTAFFQKEGNQAVAGGFKGPEIVLVCDEVGLTGAAKQAYQSLKDKRQLEHFTWSSFLAKTRKSHESFLKEAKRQREIATSPKNG